MDQLNLEVERLISTPKPSWGKASLEQQVYYRDNLDTRLNTLDLPLHRNATFATLSIVRIMMPILMNMLLEYVKL